MGSSHFGLQDGRYWTGVEYLIPTFELDVDTNRIIPSAAPESEKAYCRCVRDR